VRSGLQDGDVVVTRGNEQLSDGTLIDYPGSDAQPEKKVDS
jgi:predicted component of type VI protein secretion system